MILLVKEQSMEPWAREGDVVVTLPFLSPKTGDVVVLRHPLKNILLLKRVVRLKGEFFWVEGDNKDESSDSRIFGWIGKNRVVGKAKVFHM